MTYKWLAQGVLIAAQLGHALVLVGSRLSGLRVEVAKDSQESLN